MAATWGYALVGIEAQPVRVEAHVRSGLPGITVVGLPGTAVREAKERIRSAAASSGVPLPTQRITVNLSPADLRKEGPGLDLPVALAVLAAAGHLDPRALDRVGALGEVALDGTVRPVRGTLSVAEAALERSHEMLLLPVSGLAEASCVVGAPVVGVRTLEEALLVLKQASLRARLEERGRRWVSRSRRAALPVGGATGDMAEVAGQAYAKRALEIAAAGGHHVLLHGSPGAGKTMLARRLPSILPPLSQPEALEVTRVWSAAGLRGADLGLVAERPFRAPHHTASRAALIGGGTLPRPGEISLAHAGVLFLDELPEFSRDVLEALRQPLEDGVITIARRDASCRFPAACTLVAAMNPCPCGFQGHPRRACRCSEERIAGYVGRASGPLLDRIDLQVEVAVPLFHEPTARDEEASASIRARVCDARAFRLLREDGAEAGAPPSQHPRALLRWAGVDAEGGRRLDEAMREGLGGRGFARTLRIARTIADLDGSFRVGEVHVAEALGLRVAPARAA